jgi:hypothetical protein
MRRTLKRPLIIGATVGIALVTLVAITLWSASSKTNLQFVSQQGTDGWATAEFVVKPALTVPWVNDVGVGSTATIHVLRGGEWVELSQGEMRQRIAIDSGIQPAAGGPKVGRGYTVKVKVPTCEKWKMEIEMGEQRTLGFAMLAFQYENTQRWVSGELAGSAERVLPEEI